MIPINTNYSVKKMLNYSTSEIKFLCEPKGKCQHFWTRI